MARTIIRINGLAFGVVGSASWIFRVWILSWQSVQLKLRLMGHHSASTEKTAQVNKDGSVPPQVMEKLSNAVSSEYIIGAEDVLEITVWRNADLSKVVQVRPDGRVSMPIIRDIVAVGKTPTQLAEEMTNKLKEYVQNPVVAVSLKEVNSSNIFVLGEVKTPWQISPQEQNDIATGYYGSGRIQPDRCQKSNSHLPFHGECAWHEKTDGELR